MAERPWVTPEEVKEYSEIKSVQERSDKRLQVDIFRAEQRVIALTNNRFDQLNDDGTEKYPSISAEVKTAILLLAEAYAKKVMEVSATKSVKSETFDDYSYTAETTEIDIDDLGLDDLLRDYIEEASGNVRLRIRKL